MSHSETVLKRKNIKIVLKKISPKKEQEHANKFGDVMKELTSKIPKDKHRKVCKNCNELGHSVTSTICKINIEKNNKLKQKIKSYILSQNCLEDKSIEDYCVELSVLLSITPNFCRTLYDSIPPIELINKEMDIGAYLTNIDKKRCSDCNKTVIHIQENTHKKWKGNDICDTCWSKYEVIRQDIWRKIKEYKVTQCEICCSVQMNPSERYHYDHLNMFNKCNAICTMVNECANMEDIYSEIDKCHILCLSCHHIVTDVERKMGFARMKNLLTRQLNKCEITEEEYNEKCVEYEKIYEERMEHIYKELKQQMKTIIV